MWNLQLDLAETNGSMGCKYCGVWTICNSYSAEKNSVSIPFAARKNTVTYVAGYTSWQRNFDRQVMKGEKGIKILAPAPYKAQEEREKIDPLTQKALWTPSARRRLK